MRNVVMLALPLSLVWVSFSGDWSLSSFVVGYILGFAVLILIRLNTRQGTHERTLSIRRLPGQLWALTFYAARLAYDVFMSGIDVGWRIIHPNMLIDPDVQKISTQDPTNDWLISALSAHSITITPGELVIDFETGKDGETIMYVHVLDKNASSLAQLESEQTERLKRIRRILGLGETD